MRRVEADCLVVGCINGRAIAKGMCSMHWNQVRNHGKVTSVLSQSHRLSKIDENDKTAYCNRCGERVYLVKTSKGWTCRLSARARTVRNNLKKFDIPDEVFRNEPENCEICGNKQTIGNRKYLCYDHDHSTGEFRGWLCNHCNYLLGYARDDQNILAKAILYLKR